MSGGGDERCARFRRFEAAEAACRRGDLDALRVALGDPPGSPDCVLDVEFLGLADRPLDLAIRLGPPELLLRMLALGADPRAPAEDGFPPLFAAIDAPREDRRAILAILLAHGADPMLRTRIDDLSTPIEDAEATGFAEAAALMRAAIRRRDG